MSKQSEKHDMTSYTRDNHVKKVENIRVRLTKRYCFLGIHKKCPYMDIGRDFMPIYGSTTLFTDAAGPFYILLKLSLNGRKLCTFSSHSNIKSI